MKVLDHSGTSRAALLRLYHKNCIWSWYDNKSPRPDKTGHISSLVLKRQHMLSLELGRSQRWRLNISALLERTPHDCLKYMRSLCVFVFAVGGGESGGGGMLLFIRYV